MIRNESPNYHNGSVESYMSSSSPLQHESPSSPTPLLTTITNNTNNNNNFSNDHQPTSSRVQTTTFSNHHNNINNSTTNNHSSLPHHLILSATTPYSHSFDLILFYHFMEESKRANLLQIMLEAKQKKALTTSTSPHFIKSNSDDENITNSSSCSGERGRGVGGNGTKMINSSLDNTIVDAVEPWLVVGNVKNVRVACEVAEMLIRYSSDTNKRWLFQMATVKASMSDVSIDEILHHLIWLATSYVPPPSATKRKTSLTHSHKPTTSTLVVGEQTTQPHPYKRRNSNKSNNSSGTTSTNSATTITKQPDHGSVISQNGNNRNNSLYSSSLTSVSSISSCSTDNSRTLSVLSTTSSILDDDQSSNSPNTESILQSIPLHQNPTPTEPVKIVRKVLRKVYTSSATSSPISPMTPPIYSPSISDSDYSSSPSSSITSRPQIVQKGVLRKATITPKVIRKVGRSPGDIGE